MSNLAWYHLYNAGEIPSPAILLFPDRIAANIQTMIDMAGSPDRLRPHVKTHKLPQVVKMQLDAGITRFKCATLTEAEMLATTGAKDILIAHHLYGPALNRLQQLILSFPEVTFSTLVDHAGQVTMLQDFVSKTNLTLGVFLDIDAGMERTGVQPGPQALEIYKQMAHSSRLIARGLHVYDGHLRQSDLLERKQAAASYYPDLDAFIESLNRLGLPLAERVFGGSPTFTVHFHDPEKTLSPGTVFLWDWGYSSGFKDLPFQHAAVLLTRVISKPGKGKLCLDLGHKSVASEMPAPRVHLFDIPDHQMTGHSEEHMVIATENAHHFSAGDCIYGVPVHICPTMALHEWVWVVRDGVAQEKWQVTARSRF